MVSRPSSASRARSRHRSVLSRARETRPRTIASLASGASHALFAPHARSASSVPQMRTIERMHEMRALDEDVRVSRGLAHALSTNDDSSLARSLRLGRLGAMVRGRAHV